jgi:hypothetical protein
MATSSMRVCVILTWSGQRPMGRPKYSNWGFRSVRISCGTGGGAKGKITDVDIGDYMDEGQRSKNDGEQGTSSNDALDLVLSLNDENANGDAEGGGSDGDVEESKDEGSERVVEEEVAYDGFPGRSSGCIATGGMEV